MTRINAVPVGELCGKHLVSEYRELPRVFGLVRRAQTRGLCPRTVVAPLVYCLGPGHVKFFYRRLGYLLRRQGELVAEMRRRGYKVSHDDHAELGQGLAPHWFEDWEPGPQSVALSRARLVERLPGEYKS